MYRLIPTAVALSTVFVAVNVRAQGFQSASLDYRIVELKEARSLAALCAKDPQIKECRFAIGEWKPNELERVKLEVPACFDQCMLDVFGFLDYPARSATATQAL